MILIKVLAQTIIILVISAYAPQSGLDDSQRDISFDSFINVVRKLWQKKTAIIAGEFSGDLGITLKANIDATLHKK